MSLPLKTGQRLNATTLHYSHGAEKMKDTIMSSFMTKTSISRNMNNQSVEFAKTRKEMATTAGGSS
jgi:hypothetical protein